MVHHGRERGQRDNQHQQRKMVEMRYMIEKLSQIVLVLQWWEPMEACLEISEGYCIPLVLI